MFLYNSLFLSENIIIYRQTKTLPRESRTFPKVTRDEGNPLTAGSAQSSHLCAFTPTGKNLVHGMEMEYSVHTEQKDCRGSIFAIHRFHCLNVDSAWFWVYYHIHIKLLKSSFFFNEAPKYYIYLVLSWAAAVIPTPTHRNANHRSISNPTFISTASFLGTAIADSHGSRWPISSSHLPIYNQNMKTFSFFCITIKAA